MNQYMHPLAPMAPPPDSGGGGMFGQIAGAFLGQKRADADAARNQALINALRGNNAPMGGVGATTMPLDVPMAQTMGGGFNGVY